MKNISGNIDFTENESLLIDKAFEMAKSFDSKLWLMHIATADPDFVGYEVGPQCIRDGRATELRKEHKQLQEYNANLENKGGYSEGLLVQGATIEMNIEESNKLNVDLIMAGHHDHSFFYNAFTGSVSAQIIKK